ncbi:hypothetical protein N7457_003059 [Penicillium paradoxum]|uniref:uncharacterized protein n=1 Tax=Penicillium paradoxum TaxID=176176 RepID=UPI0025489BE1|nr:uncharacterized protein N7457_003059 [Penicillium paradoxum]KAJ5788069.1 hypothetical protein N7457_003059 [Penicillium paradoxum]
MAEDTLSWSSRLLVASPERAPRLTGDKITLPQSALEQLLAAAPLQVVPSGNSRVLTSSFDPFNPHTFAVESRARQEIEQRQQQLPHPLIFRIVNPQNGRFIYAGIREFSAEENEVALSAFLRDALEIKDEEFRVENGEIHEPVSSHTVTEPSPRTGPAVTVHAKQLPKGTYVRLRPLESGYDPEDWKALLERYLRDNFTTLTTGELLTVPGTRSESFRFLVDKVLPEGEGICVVDTDLEVDIVALSEEQARETLQKRLEKASRAPGRTGGSSIGGILNVGEDALAQVLPGEYVDYELRDWDRHDTLQIELIADSPEVYLFVSPFSNRQRSRPRTDMHVLGDFSGHSPKKFDLQPSNVVLEGAEALYISVHANSTSSESNDIQQRLPSQYKLRVTVNPVNRSGNHDGMEESHEPGDVQCKNCQQWVPERTLVLHENFCLRNNIFCSQCGTVFQKRSSEWQGHWHCSHDHSHGNDASSKEKHDAVFHQTHHCADCAAEFEGLPALAQHRTTDCPWKLILCQFCHLVVPQKGESDPDFRNPEVMLSGLTPHELVDGARTTECHLCNKITRLRDMNTHLRHHDLERLSRPAPRICMNRNCGRTLTKAGNESVGLCSFCFGPLYVDTHDPEGKALRRRIERRYLSQMMTGCGKPWCQNEYCKTAKQKGSNESDPHIPLNVAEVMNLTRPLVEGLNTQPTAPNTAALYLCADETSQHRRSLAELIAGESAEENNKAYDLPWCIAGVEATGGDLEKARDWLSKWAPTQSASAA